MIVSREGAKTLRKVAVDDALHAFPECWRAEVHQQAERKIHEAKVGENLLAVNRREAFDRFKLNEQFSLNEQVKPETLVESDAVEADRNGRCRSTAKPRLAKLFAIKAS